MENEGEINRLCKIYGLQESNLNNFNFKVALTCKFCLNFGSEGPKNDLGISPGQTKIFLAPTNESKINKHMETQHESKWKIYKSLTMNEKSSFFGDQKLNELKSCNKWEENKVTSSFHQSLAAMNTQQMNLESKGKLFPTSLSEAVDNDSSNDQNINIFPRIQEPHFNIQGMDKLEEILSETYRAGYFQAKLETDDT